MEIVTDADELAKGAVTAAVSLLFDHAEIPEYCYMEIAGVVRQDGRIVGVLTYKGDEWSVAVDEGHRGHGIATALVRSAIQTEGSGYMVAGTDAGAEWLYELYYKLTPEERECLEVPSWADLIGG